MRQYLDEGPSIASQWYGMQSWWTKEAPHMIAGPHHICMRQYLDEGMSTTSTWHCIDIVWFTYTLHIALCLQVKARYYLPLVIHYLKGVYFGWPVVDISAKVSKGNSEQLQESLRKLKEDMGNPDESLQTYTKASESTTNQETSDHLRTTYEHSWTT